MAYRSENIEKLKSLTEKIRFDKNSINDDFKSDILSHLEKILCILDKPRIDKKVIKNDLHSLITKLKQI
jgi:hypothetical protein